MRMIGNGLGDDEVLCWRSDSRYLAENHRPVASWVSTKTHRPFDGVPFNVGSLLREIAPSAFGDVSKSSDTEYEPAVIGIQTNQISEGNRGCSTHIVL